VGFFHFFSLFSLFFSSFFYLLIDLLIAHSREPLRRHVISSSLIGHGKWYYYYSSSTKCTGCACTHDHFRSGPLPIKCPEVTWLTSLPVKWSH
jgi:hypothetical protein